MTHEEAASRLGYWPTFSDVAPESSGWEDARRYRSLGSAVAAAMLSELPAGQSPWIFTEDGRILRPEDIQAIWQERSGAV